MYLNRKLVSLVVACAFSVWLSLLASGQAAPHNVVVVELFTSEGCSSCPPADELLRRVNNKQTSAGQLIVGISEHVTYWNQLGWADPFSSANYTERQNRYATHFSLDSVYTPQMVVNGQEEFVGGDEASLSRAFKSEATRKRIDLRILSSEVCGNTIKIRFSAGNLLSSHPLDIIAVLTDDMASSNVLRGENRGRFLQHVAVARSLTKVATIHEAADMTVKIPWTRPDGKKDATHHLVLFAQDAGQGPIVGTDARQLSLDVVH